MFVKNILALSALGALSLGQLAFAEESPPHPSSPSPAPSPAVGRVSMAKFQVLYGERRSEFSISKEESGYFIHFTSNEVRGGKKRFSSENAQYVFAKLQKMPLKKENKENCKASFMSVEATASDGKPIEAVACLDSNSQTAQGLREMINLLTVLF